MSQQRRKERRCEQKLGGEKKVGELNNNADSLMSCCDEENINYQIHAAK